MMPDASFGQTEAPHQAVSGTLQGPSYIYIKYFLGRAAACLRLWIRGCSAADSGIYILHLQQRAFSKSSMDL